MTDPTISIRDYFIGQCLAGLLANPAHDNSYDSDAATAVKQADAAMKARGEQPETKPEHQGWRAMDIDGVPQIAAFSVAIEHYDTIIVNGREFRAVAEKEAKPTEPPLEWVEVGDQRWDYKSGKYGNRIGHIHYSAKVMAFWWDIVGKEPCGYANSLDDAKQAVADALSGPGGAR